MTADTRQTQAPEGRAQGWLSSNAGWAVALFGVLATLAVGAWQISENRAAANQRAKLDRELQQAQADSQLELAAVSVILDSPSCEAAEARARLAKAVLEDKLPADFVARAHSIRAVAFPSSYLALLAQAQTPEEKAYVRLKYKPDLKLLADQSVSCSALMQARR